jgi:TonB-linked SusC/RagA family outer membrane protein
MKKMFFLLLFVGCMLQLTAQTRQLKGKVTEEGSGKPLEGVSVVEKSSNTGTKTDAQGNFTLSVKSDAKNTQLVFSFVGFRNETVTASGNDAISIKLSKEVKELDEVVVIGYGTSTKKDLTGAVVSIKSEEIKKVPATNVMEALQGKIAGVDIVRTSGSAGANVNVTVRGNRSIRAGNGPLYIVDGIQYDNFQDINPNDIESMEVLKDGSSTAIYGSKGANGVILISTKKGTAGKTKVGANLYFGQSEVAGYPVPMTGPQFADLKRQAYRTANPTYNPATDDAKVFTSPADLAAVQSGASYYYPGYMLGKGSQQDYNVNVSSGTEKTKVYFSFDYLKEKGLLHNDYSNRYALRLNIDQTILNTLKVGLESQLAYYDQNIRNDGVLNQGNKVLPFYAPYAADGVTLLKNPGNGAQFNPLLNDVPGSYVNKTNTTRLLSTAYVEWKPLSSLSIRSNLGVVNASSRNGFFEDANTINRALSTGSQSRITNSHIANLTWENIITWKQQFGDHNVGLTGLTSWLSNRSENNSASGTGQLLANQSFYALQNNPSNVLISSGYVGSNLNSYAFRANYGYKGKYLFTVTGRSDGASVLSPQNRWSFFPSAAAAWRISDEAFMSNNRVFSDLKLRVSYGVAGNSAVSPYQTQSGIILIPYSFNDVSALAYGLDPQIGNTDLKWELTKSFDIGLDFSIIKNRVSGSIDYYDSKTDALLYLVKLPATTGGTSILGNVGKTQNSGFELALRTVNIEKKDFSWITQLTFSTNKERIIELPNGQNDVASGFFLGSPVRSFYDYQKVGIWQTADATLATSYGYKPGDIRVEDIDGDKKITALGDRLIVGSQVPKYTLGFNNDFKFRQFDFNVYVYARVGQTFQSDYAGKFEPNAIENSANVDYWTPENATNEYPRPNINISKAAMPFASTLAYKDGSFLKIRTITLGYTFPTSLTSKIGIGSLRWYVSARNYVRFSKVKDYDPEGGGSFERPLTKLIVTGLTIGF